MPHAIMQVYRGAYGGTQVKNGYYGNQEFFHIAVKVERFFGMDFIKFRKKLVKGPAAGGDCCSAGWWASPIGGVR
jgi:hypothetical protein